jgi:DNA-binding Lrp family transcriptional regulator
MNEMKSNEIVVLNFAEAKQPVFNEKTGKNGGWVEYGENNQYPTYLLEMFNKSAKHNAIVQGKVNYISGNGWAPKTPDPVAEQFIAHPNEYESLNDLTTKISLDIELFGGCYLEIIWSLYGGELYSINHVDFTKIRSNKDNTQFWFKDDWADQKGKPVPIPGFNPNIRSGKQILYLKEYRPGLGTYTLPGYFGALNFILSDIEVSKHILGNAQTGWTPSKMITMTNGEPTQEEKREITRKFTDRFSGSDGKKFIISWAKDATRKPIIEDLGTSDLTKEDFSRIDEIIQQNLMSGHRIVSPMLFGIKTEGQLGGTGELQTAFEIFKSTYANDKQRFIESTMNMLLKIKGGTSEIKITPIEPISIQLSEQTLVQIAPKQWLLEKAGIDLSKYQNDPSNVAGDNQTQVEQSAPVNESLKNMTGRQYQQLMRIIRQFSQNKISKEIATTMLRSGLGLSDAEINSFLGVDDDPETDDQQFADHDDPEVERAISCFMEFGESKENFNVLGSRAVMSSHQTFADDYLIDRTKDKQIAELIQKDPLIPNEVIARAIGKPIEFVSRRIQYLTDLGALVINPNGQRLLAKPLSEIIDKPMETTIEVRYSYEWKPQFAVASDKKATTPLIKTSRAFCARLLTLNRVYTRAEIESMSARLGYSVFDRGGGWWTRKGGSVTTPDCRHEWRSNVLIRKK